MVNVLIAGLLAASVAVTITSVFPKGTLLAVTMLRLVSTAKINPGGILVYAMLTGLPLVSVATAEGNVTEPVGLVPAMSCMFAC